MPNGDEELLKINANWIYTCDMGIYREGAMWCIELF